MILGFSHLTLSTSRSDYAIERLEARGYRLSASHPSIPSSPLKWPLMHHRAERHDLSILGGPITVEVVSHDTPTFEGTPVLDLEDDLGYAIWRTAAPEADSSFLTEGLSFIASGDEFQLRGALPAWSVKLRLVATSDTRPPPLLDVEGFSCLALNSNNLEKDAERLETAGAREFTDIFEITLGARRMDILMLRSPGGAIVELVKVKRP